MFLGYLIIISIANITYIHCSYISYSMMQMYLGFPGGSDSKESACNAGDSGLSPWSRRSSGEVNSYPLSPGEFL